MPRPALPVLAAALLAGCATFPELDAAITPEARRAEYPVLVPVEGLLDRRETVQIAEDTERLLRARADRLRARAALLRGASVDDELRRRLAARLERLGG